jgi:hypothetical protein
MDIFKPCRVRIRVTDVRWMYSSVTVFLAINRFWLKIDEKNNLVQTRLMNTDGQHNKPDVGYSERAGWIFTMCYIKKWSLISRRSYNTSHL